MKDALTNQISMHPLRFFGVSLVGVFILGFLIGVLFLKTRESESAIHRFLGKNSVFFGKLNNEINKQNQEIQKIENKISEISKKLSKKVSTPQMVRFNPFGETGSNQSFTVAFLDDEKSGVVMSSLFGRDITKIYAKSVSEGKSETDFSPEEREVVEKL